MTPDIRPVRCRASFIRYDRWLRGAVPTMAEFAAAGFAYDDLHINYPEIASVDGPKWDLKRARLDALQTYSFALPSKEALQAIAQLSPILEVGAGTGCWARLLANLGADIIATDAKDESDTLYVQRAMLGYHFPVERLLATDAVAKYPNRNVLAVWPCLDDPWMREAAEAMQPGTRLAMVHAGRGGCIADSSIFDYLNRDFASEAEIKTPRWPGIQDRLGIWRKC